MIARVPAPGLDPDRLRAFRRDATRMAVAIALVFVLLVAWNTALGALLGLTEIETGAIGFWGFVAFGVLMGVFAFRLALRMRKARRTSAVRR